MTLREFLRNRELHKAQEPILRRICYQCMQPDFSCFCADIHRFDPKIKFVILSHPLEFKRRVATGRMAHLCLDNSELIVGHDYTNSNKVNSIINDSSLQAFVLYPGLLSTILTHQSVPERTQLFDRCKTPVIFVIDGTWATARKTMYHSQNLRFLPRLSFHPPHRSQFKVRKQPDEHCLSTIEAIHHFIELAGCNVNFDINGRSHDRLLFVFKKMVQRQFEFLHEAKQDPSRSRYRRVRAHSMKSSQSKE